MRNQIIVTVDAAANTGSNPQGRCEITGRGPIPRSELERLACDADIYGIVLSGEGLPLWHGRRTRSVSPQQWRALIACDKGCVLCALAPAFCHAHHIVPWSDGGPTDITNLALVCANHHRQIHDRNLTLTRQPDGAWTTHLANTTRTPPRPPPSAPLEHDPRPGHEHRSRQDGYGREHSSRTTGGARR